MSDEPMRQMSLCHALNQDLPKMFSFYGAGGKTTLMNRLSAELLNSGKKVMITTTTKISLPPGLLFFVPERQGDRFAKLINHFKDSSIAVSGKRILPEGKIEGLSPETLHLLQQKLTLAILVEADGAKQMPIKGHAPYEPVIPKNSDLIVAIIGSDALGSSFDNNTVHRLEQYFLCLFP